MRSLVGSGGGVPFSFEAAEDHGVSPAVVEKCCVAQAVLLGHADLGQYSGGAEIPRVTGGVDPVESQLAEPCASSCRAISVPIAWPHSRGCTMYEISPWRCLWLLGAACGCGHAVRPCPPSPVRRGRCRRCRGSGAGGVSDHALTAESTKSCVWASVFGPVFGPQGWWRHASGRRAHACTAGQSSRANLFKAVEC